MFVIFEIITFFIITIGVHFVKNRKSGDFSPTSLFILLVLLYTVCIAKWDLPFVLDPDFTTPILIIDVSVVLFHDKRYPETFSVDCEDILRYVCRHEQVCLQRSIRLPK